MYVLAINNVVQKFPYSINELKQSYPNTSFPNNMTLEMLETYNIYPVVMTGADYNDATEVSEMTGCAYNFVKNRWETTWTVRNKTPEELERYRNNVIQSVVSKTQERLDTFAQTRYYDDIKSVCDYAGCSVEKFSVEGQYCKDKRAETWQKLYEIMNEIDTGVRPPINNFEDIESELPILQWPI